MQQADAINHINKGITSNSIQRWAGFGAGTFTLALAAGLAPGSHILAIDKTRQPLPAESNGVQIKFRRADFVNDPIHLEGMHGILMANSLHYVKHKAQFLQMLNQPQFIVVEYETKRVNPWVPYPIAFNQLKKLFDDLGYQTTHLAEAPSRFGGRMYAALINLPETPSEVKFWLH
jgi:hypothetical protein